jgi:hypothetical protein
VPTPWTFDDLKKHLAEVHKTVEEAEGVVLSHDMIGYRPNQDLDSLQAIHDAEHERGVQVGRSHDH